MKTIFALILALGISTPVWAIPITVNSTTYDISWEVGTFDTVNASRGLDSLDWWGDNALATALAQALGMPTGFTPVYAHLNEGPLFGFSERLLNGQDFIVGRTRRADGAIIARGSYADTNQRAWAYGGVAAPVPEPSSIVLLMLGLAGLCFSGKARR